MDALQCGLYGAGCRDQSDRSPATVTVRRYPGYAGAGQRGTALRALRRVVPHCCRRQHRQPHLPRTACRRTPAQRCLPASRQQSPPLRRPLLPQRVGAGHRLGLLSTAATEAGTGCDRRHHAVRSHSAERAEPLLWRCRRYAGRVAWPVDVRKSRSGSDLERLFAARLDLDVRKGCRHALPLRRSGGGHQGQ